MAICSRTHRMSATPMCASLTFQTRTTILIPSLGFTSTFSHRTAVGMISNACRMRGRSNIDRSSRRVGVVISS